LGMDIHVNFPPQSGDTREGYADFYADGSSFCHQASRITGKSQTVGSSRPAPSRGFESTRKPVSLVDNVDTNKHLFVRSRRSQEGTTVEGDFIVFPHPETQKVVKSLIGSSEPKGWIPPTLKDKLLESHLWRLKYHFEWWESLPIKRHGTFNGILIRNLQRGPKFADELDDLIKYSYRWETSNCLMYSHNWPNCEQNMDGIDSFFPPCHLIPFRREETKDIELILETPKVIPEDLLALFREEARSHLVKGELFPLDDIDRITLMGGTKTFDPKTMKSLSRTEYRLQHNTLDLADEFLYKYAFVQKSPSEDRAAVIASPETLNSLRYLKKALEVSRNCPSDAMPITDFRFLEKWLSNEKYTYLMSDQKKCGLTFPRQLVREVILLLHELYPESGLDRVLDAFDKSKVFIKGKYHSQKSGTNLGMLNEYVSFIMAVLVELWKKQEGYGAGEALMYNDDQIIRFEKFLCLTTQDKNEIGLSWDSFMESFGISVHKKKPFWSDRGCFLETYGRPYDGFKLWKRGQYLGNLFHVLLATNTVEAKEFTSSIVANIGDRYSDEATCLVLKLADFFEYEFMEAEKLYSFPVGWIRGIDENGRYTLFNEFYETPINHIRSRMCAVPLVAKPVKSTKKLKLLESKFKKKMDWFMNEFNQPYVTIAVKMLKTSFSVQNIGLRNKEVIEIYHQWAQQRQQAFHGKVVDCVQMIKQMLKEDGNYAIPRDLILSMAKDEGNLECFLDELPNTELSVREQIIVGQMYGAYKSLVVNGKQTVDLLDKFRKAYSFAGDHSGLIISLSAQLGINKCKDLLNQLSITGSIPVAFLKLVPPWEPTFIPGKGNRLILFENVLGLFRVEDNSYSAYETYGEFGKYLMMIDPSGEDKEEVFKNFLHYRDNFLELDPVPVEEELLVKPLPHHCPSAAQDAEVQEMIDYIRWMVSGVSSRTQLMLGPEDRDVFAPVEEYNDFFDQEHSGDEDEIGFGLFDG
jgi:hypothetical protein